MAFHFLVVVNIHTKKNDKVDKQEVLVLSYIRKNGRLLTNFNI